MEVFHVQTYLTQVKLKQCKQDSNIKEQLSCSRIIPMVEKRSLDHWFCPNTHAYTKDLNQGVYKLQTIEQLKSQH